MKTKLTTIVISLFLLTLLFSSIAHSAGTMNAIYNAEDEEQMQEAMHDIAELSDILVQLAKLDEYEKAAVIGSVYRRRERCEDIEQFKQLLNEQIEDKTTYVSWAQGYPYLKDSGDTGANLVVKTDIDGWLLITSFGDDAQGGLSDEYSFMKFYNADNGAYKYKVWVTGGRETVIPISSGAWGSGNTYSIYYCLKTGGNESGFGQVKYTVPKFWYTLEMTRSGLLYGSDGPPGNENYTYYDYFITLTSSHDVYYEAYHYYLMFYGDDYYDYVYSTPGLSAQADTEFTTDFEVVNFIDTRITTPTGVHYYDYFDLPGPGYE